MHRTRKALMTFAMTATFGTCLQLGGCSLGSAFDAIKSFNPCGTILTCDPAEYEFIRSGIDELGASPNDDPYCVTPPFCSAEQDPIFGGVGGF